MGKYISFFGALMLIGGIIFEVPVLMALLTDAGILKTKAIKEKRAHAVIAIMVISAVITPTQDIVNMLIFAVPMIVLFELGLLISGFIENKKI